MSAQKPDVPERMRLAEEWRLAGKMLRERSPHLFQKLVEMFAVVAKREADKRGDRIGENR